MVSQFPFKRATACGIVFPILDADGDPVGGAAGLDSEISKDGAAFADCTNEAANITSGGSNTGIYSLSLTAAEMTADVICIQVKTSTVGAKTTVIVMYTAAQTLDETDVIADAIKVKTDNLPVDPADASVIDADLTTIEGKIDVIDDFLDTEVAAILADTNELQTDWANGGRLDLLLDSAKESVDTEIAAIKAVTDTLTLAGIADAVLDEVVDANNPANADTFRKVINVISAAIVGKSSGGGTAFPKFRDLGDTKNRVEGTVDADGNRTALTNLDGT